jgi:PKD repeat protein
VGEYTAVVTAANAASIVTATTTVLVIDVPIAGLTAVNDGPVALGELVNLAATISAGSNVTYLWDLGDGQTATGAAVAHIYAAVGAYTAVVTATNSAGVLTATTTVLVMEVPITGLTATSDSPTPLGSVTQFAATISSGTNVAYSWDFGDGTTGSGTVVHHVYAAVGAYTAVVTATNSAGAMTATTQVVVEDVPISGLMVSSDGPTPLGQATHFTASVGAGSNVSYSWDFGDGQSATGWQVSHVYQAAGSYTVTVTAQNGVSSQTAVLTVNVTQLLYRVYLPLVLKP